MSYADVPTRSGYSLKSTVYGDFRGVDFSVDSSLVSKSRSPYAPNLISDKGGMPEKRLGWRTLLTLDSPINGIFYTVLNEVEYTLVHGGTKIYKITDDGSYEVLKTGVANNKSTSFYLSDIGEVEDSEEGESADETVSIGSLYILTGSEYLCFNGEEITSVLDNPYVPNVVAGSEPSGGGTVIEPVNLLTNQRMQSFVGTEDDLTYYLCSQNIDSVDKIEISNDEGGKDELATNKYSVDLEEGTVKFTTYHERIVAGKDNIFITFSKAVEGYSERITNCKIAAVYGLNNNNKVFLSGNDEYKGKIWHSYTGRPNYFPDTYYIVAGSEENKVMGFCRLGKYLLAVKEDNQQDSTIFQIWGELYTDVIAYMVEQGIAGVGALGSHTFDTLLDEPLFLSSQGIMAIYTNSISEERTIKNRSYFVDAQLGIESNLEDAVSVQWNGYYILCVNNRCYVLDSRNIDYRNNQTSYTGDFVYECYHWENFPARCFLTKGEELYFGTEDGRICKLNTDVVSKEKYNDDDEAVVAVWSTKNDDDGASYLLKTMTKKGASVTIKPYVRSSCKVYFNKDGFEEEFVTSHLMDIFSWDDIDFTRFTFNTNESPQDVYLNKKVKKYKRLQIIIKNDSKGEGFGILQIVKCFYVGNFAK